MLAINQPKIYKSGAALVVEALKNSCVTNIFGYPGASVLSLYNELADVKEITHCLCRHEQACVHAAEGYARVSGKPGVVLVTSGPGATNTLTGIADAYADSTPLVVIAGAPNSKGGKVFQNVDFVSMAKPVVKEIFTPDIDDNVYMIIKKAVNAACTGKKGPVLVELSRAVLENNFEVTDVNEEILQTSQELDVCVSEIVSLINSAASPLFIVGGGCRDEFYNISALASLTDIQVVTTLMGVGNISADVSTYQGMIGVNGSLAANKAVSESDLIIAFGVAFSDRTTCKSGVFANGTPVINVNIEPYKFGNVNVVKEVNCDCGLVIKQLIKSGIVKRAEKEKNAPVLSHLKTNGKMSTEDVLNLINSYTKSLNPVIITDVGQHQMIAAKCFEFHTSKRFLTSGGMGTMGFGLPASCGVHFAQPDSCIINITGDGSFQMNIQELATVSEYNVPVKIFVMNNGYLGMIRQMQEKFFGGKCYQSKIYNPDFIKLAEGYNIKGYRVSDISGLYNILPEVFAEREPVIIDCFIDEFENV